MSRLISLVGITGLIAVLVLIAIRTRAESPDTLRIATGTPGGTYIAIGNRFRDILDDLPGAPIPAETQATRGSIENIERLLAGEADLALVSQPALTNTARGLGDLRVLAYLYEDVVQLVVHPDAEIETLSDLENKCVYIGSHRGATRLIATKLLDAAGITPADYWPFPPEIQGDAGEPASVSYSKVSGMLVDYELDAAFFAAGTPTPAVARAMAGGGRLLDLDADLDMLLEGMADLGARPAELDARFYPEQRERVRTVKTPVFLVCRKRLSDELVMRVLDALFDNIGEMLLAHTTTAQDIRLQHAFPDRLPAGVDYHPGAVRFKRAESAKLLIATGAIHGKYYNLGREIVDLLEQDGLASRVIHTDGSVENAWLLSRHPGLAILQYDVALAALLGSPKTVYELERPSLGALYEDGGPLHVPDLRRIATLHEERVFIVARRDRLPTAESGAVTVSALQGLRVCLGPANSGTSILARAILARHDVTITRHPSLPVDVMVRQLTANGDDLDRLDAGFFVSGMPSEALSRLLADDRYRLLSVDPGPMQPLTRYGIVSESTISDEFPCQLFNEPDVTSLSTDAVLVTRADTPLDIERITRVIFGGRAFLSIKDKDRLQKHLHSLTLHDDAKAVYMELGILPKPPKITLLELAAHVLAIAVIIVAAGKGARVLWRERINDRIKDRILEIAHRVEDPGSIRQLAQTREEVRWRARMPWWHSGHLDRSRWHDLEAIIDHHVREAWSYRTKALLDVVRSLADLDDADAREHATELRQRVWQLAVEDELDMAQVELVLRALEETVPIRTVAP